MDSHAVLAAYDDQIRRNPAPDGPDGLVERDGGVVRSVAPEHGWNGVTWSDLDEDTADAAIAAQVARFAEVSRPWEWKHYSHDRPADLPERLVADVADLALDVSPPPGVELVDVVDAAGAEALVRVHDEVFGGDHSAIGRHVLGGLARRPRTVAAVVATVEGRPVCAGRLELHHGTDFASIWGGGTLPEWRGRGVFRAVVAYRAAQAAAHGFRYVQVDASPDSRPILRRLGFVELATTTPFTHPGGVEAGQGR